MRLEFEENISGLSFVDNAVTRRPLASEGAEMLATGIKAAQEGRRAEARALLLRVTEADSNSETAWLWLASLSEYPEELLVFLNNVLRINSRNERALEWKKATKSLLAKTLVQRGIDASKENKHVFARQCFQQALEHEENSEIAWLWLASVCDTDDEKVTCMEKVLDINPANETALSALDAMRAEKTEALLDEAISAAAAGDSEAAKELLETVFVQNPELEEAWVLRAHMAETIGEREECFRKIIELNPENEMARASLASWQALTRNVAVRSTAEADSSAAEAPEPAAFAPAEESGSAPADESTAELFAEHEAPEAFATDEHETVQFESGELFPVETSAVQDVPEAFDFGSEEVVLEDVMIETPFEEFEFGGDFDGAAPAAPVETALTASADESDEILETGISLVEENGGETAALSFEFNETPTGELGRFSYDFFGAPENQETPVSAGETPAALIEETGSTDMPAGEDWDGSLENPFSSFLYKASEDSHELQFKETSVFDKVTEEYFEQAAGEFGQAEFLPSEEPQTEPSGFDERDGPAQDDVTAYKEAGAPAGSSFEVEFAGQYPATEMPAGSFSAVEQPAPAEQFANPAPGEGFCPFCGSENDPQAFVCGSCRAVLSLSDIEMLLTHREADQDVIRSAVEALEQVRADHPLEAEHLIFLGIGHINLNNLRRGFTCLQEAVQLSPSNVVLGAQVNALAIRLAEIEEQQSAQESLAKNKKILVVDDSPTVRKLISGKLEKCGHEVICAVDGLDALEKMKQVTPDLILLDITMPRMDGYQVCKLIRNNEETKNIPIVMISGKDGFFDKVRGRMAGTTGYITKPFGPEALMKTVESFLS